MPTRNVVLTDRQVKLIDHLVNSGRFQNASEVLREGVRLVETREAEDMARLEALRTAVQVGITDIEGGRFRTLNRSGLRKRLNTLNRSATSSAAGRKPGK
jgi:antitoxin ParD1/3/4